MVVQLDNCEPAGEIVEIWKDGDTRLECLIVKSKVHGNLCGYVGVPKSSLLYRVDCRAINNEKPSGRTTEFHCSLAFSGLISVDARLWWFGFCTSKSTQEGIPYVQEECAGLAQQLVFDDACMELFGLFKEDMKS